MKMAAALVLTVLAGGASAQSEVSVFRTVSFICADNPDSTAFVETENVLGQRIALKVTFIDGVATLFVVSKAQRGSPYHSVKQIDLRTERQRADIRRAHGLADKISAEGFRYCRSEGAELRVARDELSANHEFNRSHPLYRGK